MKRTGPPSTCVAYAFVVFLFAATSAGQLAVNPSPMTFGSVQLGNSVSQSAFLSNTGNSSLTISKATVSGTGFGFSGLSMPLTLAPGQAVGVAATFAPQFSGSTSGSFSLTYSVQKTKSHGKGSPPSNGTSTISLSGTGATPVTLSANPTSLSFGNVQVGTNNMLPETLTNSGGSNVTISQANVTGSGFTMSGLSLPLTLAPGQSFTFGTTFTPVSADSITGNIAVISDGANPTLNIALFGSGTVLGQLSVNPTSMNFGSVVVGISKSLTATLNATTASVTVTSATASTAEFAISGLSLPVTIAAGQSASFTVTFTPQASGDATATATLVSNASNSPIEQTLAGTGTPTPQHSVDLAWSPSNSNDVIGYNIYRSSRSGGSYTKINSALDATAAYSDASVLAGQPYYYVTTAVDGNGLESAYSNEAQAVIPSP